MEIFLEEPSGLGLDKQAIIGAVEKSLRGKSPKKALLIPPDFTRYYSNAGFITCAYYDLLTKAGCETDILPALGTHVAMTREECEKMYPGIPHDRFKTHNWREDIVSLGELSADYLAEITEGLWNEPIKVEINSLIMDPSYELIISIGQVVPHEVIGMANHTKNLFVGCGGSDMINKSHMVGAVYGMERMMGKDFTPVRKMFDYSYEKYLKKLPLFFALTVTTAPGGMIRTHGLFIGEGRKPLEEAVRLAQQRNIDFLPSGLKKCVVYLDPEEFKSTWLGNKAVYRTRMAMADGGELIILAPGVERFGEDKAIDSLIRKYGYCGRLKVLELFKQNEDLRNNMSAAAHLIHGSSDDRFSVTYSVKKISQEEIRSVNFRSADYDDMAKKYDPQKLKDGFNTVDGEEIFFVSNPALGLWIDKSKF